MRRDELITKLAMELAEWPVRDALNVRLTDNGNGTTRWGWVYSDDKEGFSKEEWRSERERLINKPKWDDAPEWANYLCQQQTGVWCWYAYEPDLEWNKWAGGAVNRSVPACNGSIPVGHDWRDTLEKRPEPMPKDWIGEGMPPVGTICEAKLDSDAWVEAEILAHYRPNGPNARGPEVAVFAYRRTPTSDNRHVDQLIPEFFRPLRSEEDKAVEEMVEAIVAHYEYPKGAETYLGLARTLYRAGYRKTGGDA